MLVLHHHLHELPYELFVEEDIKDKRDTNKCIDQKCSRERPTKGV